ncbi:hypothetical protein Scep_001510 [Stephania cephalantha]|uniref:Inhibitor I9 domain-containing protein n=1 Tax=Stephania cephalantha TaxID=152367 RepID=A0AAP0LC51_9MAGN
MGAGHINPKKALNPGLIYNASTEDYLPLLPTHGYSFSSSTDLSSVLSHPLRAIYRLSFIATFPNIYNPHGLICHAQSIRSWYHATLSSISQSTSTNFNHQYSYTYAITGFCAKLTPLELNALQTTWVCLLCS